jgi:hypothetical protein
VGSAVCLLLITVVAVSLARVRAAEDDAGIGAVASPVSASVLDLGVRPPDRVIATAGAVEIHLPVDRSKAKLTLFRSVDDVTAIALDPDESWKHTVAPADGRAGPETAALDISAPPQTIVFSPVDGKVAAVTDYIVRGKKIGFQLDITPDVASDIVVRVRQIDPIDANVRNVQDPCGVAGVPKPRVGEPVTAGVTCIGEVRDVKTLLEVARPEIAKFTSDGGNHVHMEVVRVGT